jgi:hypothetical protein
MKWEVQRKEGGKDDAGDGVQRESRECHDEKKDSEKELKQDWWQGEREELDHQEPDPLGPWAELEQGKSESQVLEGNEGTVHEWCICDP